MFDIQPPAEPKEGYWKKPPGSVFGAQLREWREARELTQSALRELAGLTKSHISILERGYAHPSPDVCQRLADALDLPVETITEISNKSRKGWTPTVSDYAGLEVTVREYGRVPVPVSKWISAESKRLGLSRCGFVSRIICAVFYQGNYSK